MKLPLGMHWIGLGELRRVLTAMAADTANNLRNHVEQGELITKQAANYLEAMELGGWTDNELEAFKADLLDPFLKLDPEQADENDKANLLALQPAVDRWEQTIRNLLPRCRGVGCAGSGYPRRGGAL